MTPALESLLRPDDPRDPIARQFLPSLEENEPDPQALPDPIGDKAHSPVPGIVHRYPDRLLLNLSLACPAYCRFCFRRGQVGRDGVLSPEETEAALAYIRSHKEVWEVIFSGGEPLALAPRRLREIFTELRAVAHVKTLRVHTRLPIAMPESVTPELVALLAGGVRPVNMLVHCNHPRELGGAQRAALARLAEAGIPLFSQSVLLKGVNDDPETLADLMRAFVECRIKPHYLHHPDKAQGTKHFRLSLAEGITIVQALRGRFSGLCQPRYMLDIPGGHGKVDILSDAVRKTQKGWLVRNFKGEFFDYFD